MIMRLSRPTVTVVILVVIVAALISLAYPLVPVSQASTETFYNTSTYTENHSTTLVGTLVATIQIPYSTATALVYTAYPLCDPASLACPGPPILVVTTISGNSVYLYQTASTSQWAETYTTENSVLTVHTNTQEIPIYSAQGLSSAQFVQLTIATVIVGLIVFLLTHKTTETQRKQQSYRPVKDACRRCGAEYLSPTSAFCFKCGAPRDSF